MRVRTEPLHDADPQKDSQVGDTQSQRRWEQGGSLRKAERKGEALKATGRILIPSSLPAHQPDLLPAPFHCRTLELYSGVKMESVSLDPSVPGSAEVSTEN